MTKATPTDSVGRDQTAIRLKFQNLYVVGQIIHSLYAHCQALITEQALLTKTNSQFMLL